MISVIVPTYKGKRYIPNIIEMAYKNALNITEELELVLVNDYPNEDIKKYVDIYLNDRKLNHTNIDRLYVKVKDNETNVGIHKSRINGIDICSGDFILMLDQDDTITEDYLASQIKAIKNADVVVANGIEQKNGYNKMLYKYPIMQWTVRYLWFYVMFDSRIISPGQCLIRKESIPEKWLSNPLKNSGADDYMLWLLMLAEGRKFAINRNCLYTHVYTASNLSLDTSKIKQSTTELLSIIGDELGKRNVNTIRRRLEQEKKSWLVKIVENINKISN